MNTLEDFMTKEERMKVAYDRGFKYEQDYRGCAQCAIAAIQDAIGIRNDHVYKAGSGLAGGGGECIDGNCGGYTGAAMMFGLLFGRTRAKEGANKGRLDKYATFHLTSALHDKYVEKYGSVLCSGVQNKIYGRSFNLRDDEEKKLFREAGAHELPDKCCAVVGYGAKWGVELIFAEIEKRGLALDDFKNLEIVEQ